MRCLGHILWGVRCLGNMLSGGWDVLRDVLECLGCFWNVLDVFGVFWRCFGDVLEWSETHF